MRYSPNFEASEIDLLTGETRNNNNFVQSKLPSSPIPFKKQTWMSIGGMSMPSIYDLKTKFRGKWTFIV